MRLQRITASPTTPTKPAKPATPRKLPVKTPAPVRREEPAPKPGKCPAGPCKF